MVDGHVGGCRRIDIVGAQEIDGCNGSFGGHIESTGEATDISGCGCVQTHAKRRHQLQEKAIKVICAEGDDQLRIEFFDSRRSLGVGSLQFRPCLRFPGVTVEQRAVGGTNQ